MPELNFGDSHHNLEIWQPEDRWIPDNFEVMVTVTEIPLEF